MATAALWINTTRAWLSTVRAASIWHGRTTVIHSPISICEKLDLDGNRAFAGDVKVNDDSYTAARRENPSVAAAGGSVYIAWEDNRNGDTTDNIYAQELDASGARANGITTSSSPTRSMPWRPTP